MKTTSIINPLKKQAAWMECISKFVDDTFTGTMRSVPTEDVPEKPNFILYNYDTDNDDYFLKVFQTPSELQWYIAESYNCNGEIFEVIVCEGNKVDKVKVVQVKFTYKEDTDG